MSDTNAYQRVGQIEIGPLLERYAVPYTSSTSPIDREIMLADRMAERSGDADMIEDLEAQLEEMTEERDGLKDDLKKAETEAKEARDDLKKALDDLHTLREQIALGPNHAIVDLIDARAERDRLREDLKDLRTKHEAFVAFVKERAKKTYETWVGTDEPRAGAE